MINVRLFKKIILEFIIASLIMGVFNVSYAASAELANAKQLGFGHIYMPDNISNDEFVVKSLYFTLKEEAKKIKNITINYNNSIKTPDDLIIEVHIDKYALNASWFEPYADTIERVVWEKEQKWKDSKGKEHTMHVKHYQSEIYDRPGGYHFSGSVGATINLLEAKTGKILFQYKDYKIDDKEIDAYTSIVKKFYSQVNKAVKESKKAYSK